MNKYQRIILVVGAIAFTILILTTPRVYQERETLMSYSELPKETRKYYAPLIPASTAAIRGFSVLGATIMLYFASRGIISKKTK